MHCRTRSDDESNVIINNIILIIIIILSHDQNANIVQGVH